MNICTRFKEARDKKGYTQKVLSEIANVEQQTISNIENNPHVQPKALNLLRLVRALDTTIEWIVLGEKPATYNLSKKELFRGIPVITWEEAGKSRNLSNNIKLSEDTEMLPNFCNAGVNSFSLIIKGDQMNANPGVRESFVEGDKIIIDPDVQHQNGDFVIARLKQSEEAFFKQYFYEDGRHYLTSLNPKLSNTIELNDDLEIVGVYVGLLRQRTRKT